MSELDFLEGETPLETPAPESARQEQAAPDQPVRDEQGRFAPKEPAAQPQADPVSTPAPVTAQAPVAPPVAPQAPQSPPENFVPLSAFKELERQFKELKRAPVQPVQATPPPDRYEDPEGHDAYQQSQVAGMVLNTKLELSEDMAVSRHGQDKVDAAKEWALARFEASPSYRQEVLTNRNPYEKVMQDHQRDQIASSVSMTEFEQFQAWKAAQAGLTPAPQPSPSITPAPAPPRSLASATSANGAQPHDSGNAYDGLFSQG